MTYRDLTSLSHCTAEYLVEDIKWLRHDSTTPLNEASVSDLSPLRCLISARPFLTIPQSLASRIVVHMFGYSELGTHARLVEDQCDHCKRHEEWSI